MTKQTKSYVWLVGFRQNNKPVYLANAPEALAGMPLKDWTKWPDLASHFITQKKAAECIKRLGLKPCRTFRGWKNKDGKVKVGK